MALSSHVTLEGDCAAQVIIELNKMSVVNFEGLRFPKLAVRHEVNAFVAASKQGAGQPLCSVFSVQTDLFVSLLKSTYRLGGG